MHALTMLTLLVVSAVGVAGCESMGTAAQSKTVQGAALGSAIGAGGGAIIGHQSDHAGAGTAVGAGLGAVAGGLVGNAFTEQEQRELAGTITGPRAVVRAKFCPVDGELFSSDVRYCPTHGTELRSRESM